jgi:hypothetical protein
MGKRISRRWPREGALSAGNLLVMWGAAQSAH